ncbi:pimeloyl-ACP methyl ester esterase BioH [Vibrio casei]|uniref:Pimeloyl-[acyl-carrier protein] methyl ester esterase n=1 Tax=Vibrio casei TaxID=673372 RepID=A0A368LGC0_9VIBR|nr:pimeloyl-ACP methyl ester esterase BioH [Vibrio casei]RCS69194.1 pimeloyl-[acyl-carrier protein] methyl ester esterase [Vibrio casei]SJN37725.1 Biotin synthesis protein BioH [Vibrio casei]
MTTLHWQSQGEGQDIVLIHGWGMNGAVWQTTMDTLSQLFRVHSVDLPGYGLSHEQSAIDLDDICQQVLAGAPEKAVYLGWSLGGLVATNIALKHPERVNKLITVASSPKFAAEKGWRGIMPKVLTDFTQQLTSNFKLTIEGFMMLQALGSPSARHDVKAIKKQVFSRPMPNPQALKVGLGILSQVDLRPALSDITVPMLRLYGRLDGLVPNKIADAVANYVPESESYVFQSSSHAPFMTEHGLFCEKVETFVSEK